MKIIVGGTDLSNAVMKVSKAISVRTTSEILEGIKMSVKGDNLTLTATDMEIAIEKTVMCDTYSEGEALIPGKIFTEFTKKLENEDQVEIETDDSGRIKISYGSSEVKFAALPVDEFPVVKKDLREKTFTILQKDLKEIVGRTVFCCSTNESRPILKGCLFEVEGDALTAVGIDGVRLAIAKKKIKSASADFKVIIPARALGEITRLLEKDEEEITFVSEKNSLMIEVDGTVFVTRLLEGNYMNYRQLIPTEYVTTVRVGRVSLLNSLERALVVAKENNNLVKFDIRENSVTVFANTESGNVNESVTVNFEGKDMSIAFNSKFLCDALKAVGDEFVNMYFINNISPLIIKPYSGDEYLYLILPMKINNQG